MIATSIEATAAAAVVTFAVGASLGSTQRYLKGRGSDLLADRRLRKNGDHVAITSHFVSQFDNRGGERLVAGVAAAPSVSFKSGVTLDAETIERWRGELPELATLPRDYLNPDELIRYRSDELDDERQLQVTPVGIIDTVQPVDHQRRMDGEPALDLVSFIRAIVPPVVAISDGAHRRLFGAHLRSKRLDWQITLSRTVRDRKDTYDTNVPWSSIVFPKSSPRDSTAGQQAPMNKAGLASDALRNIAADTKPSVIVNAVVRALIMRAGYSGIDLVLDEVAVIVDREIAGCSSAHR